MVQRGNGSEPSKVRLSRCASLARFSWSVPRWYARDESRAYVSIEADYRRVVVQHMKREYARRVDGVLVSTNGIENFWSLFKRALVGQHHSVSVKHLSRYLDESVYKFNHRHAADASRLRSLGWWARYRSPSRTLPLPTSLVAPASSVR